MTKPGAPYPAAYGAADGAIQPHGVLIALDGDLRVVIVSTNVKGLLGVAAEDAVGRSLADLLGPTAAATVAERVAADLMGEPLALDLDELVVGAELAGHRVDVSHHRSGGRVVVEVEPLTATAPVRITYASTRGAMARLAGTGTVAELATRLAVEVRALLGFDRVLVHRFDDEWGAEVVADERRDGLGSLPAAPDPASALAAGAGLIADVGHAPVPLHPVLDPDRDAPLDLSGATLRSCSPAYVERLAELGVTASMSLALVVDDEPWGLVACHHYSGPLRPTHDARAAVEILGQVASQLTADRERADARERMLVAQSVLGRMTARIAAGDDNPLTTTMADPELLSLVHATGAALCHDGEVRTRGIVPGHETMQRIAEALQDPERYATRTDRIADLVPELAGSADVAGVLRIGSAKDRWLLWFRPDVGGGRSLPWAPWKVEIADALGSYLTGLLLSRSREQIAMAESVQRSVVIDRPPVVAGVELAARYRPASSYQLGGDWWDAFELDDGSLAFVVGDVAGHGVSAASAMIQVRTALRAYLVEGHGPATCLDRLDHLMSSLLDERVATAVVGRVDPARTRVEIASAGHPPPILLRGREAVEPELVVRPLLGVGVGEAVATVLTPAPGSTLLLYTDGLVERRGSDLVASTTRLRENAAASHGPGDLDAWLEQVLARQEAEEPRGGTTVDDDTTVLALRFTVGAP